MKTVQALVVLLVGLITCGCRLTEIGSKHKLGVEYRHSGANDHEAQRYTFRQGLVFKWDDGSDTTITYRRRDVNDGAGDHDDGVWIEFSYPVWKAPDRRKDDLSRRVQALERQVASLTAAHE
ncbi:MAG: hypothetical protein V3W34_14775 [Phycisphaerae bacterium]